MCCFDRPEIIENMNLKLIFFTFIVGFQLIKLKVSLCIQNFD